MIQVRQILPRKIRYEGIQRHSARTSHPLKPFAIRAFAAGFSFPQRHCKVRKRTWPAGKRNAGTVLHPVRCGKGLLFPARAAGTAHRKEQAHPQTENSTFCLATLIVAAVLTARVVMIVRLNMRIDGGVERITAENFSDTSSDGVNYFTFNGRTIRLHAGIPRG